MNKFFVTLMKIRRWVSKKKKKKKKKYPAIDKHSKIFSRRFQTLCQIKLLRGGVDWWWNILLNYISLINFPFFWKLWPFIKIERGRSHLHLYGNYSRCSYPTFPSLSAMQSQLGGPSRPFFKMNDSGGDMQPALMSAGNREGTNQWNKNLLVSLECLFLSLTGLSVHLPEHSKPLLYT